MAKTKYPQRPPRLRAPTPVAKFDPFYYIRPVFDDIKGFVPIGPWEDAQINAVVDLWMRIMPAVVRWHSSHLTLIVHSLWIIGPERPSLQQSQIQ